MNSLRFPELSRRGLSHFFTLREVGSPLDGNLPAQLESEGLPGVRISAEQIHGAGVARVGLPDAGKVIPGVDALITREKGITLVIRVADCGPVWLHCAKTGAVGLAHSGRKGTELGVVQATVRAMKNQFESDPRAMMALLGPCIRPPHYDVDFASEILRQLKAEGVSEIVDCGLCTASDPGRFYSYRREKGKTGRHFAVLSLSPMPRPGPA